MYSIISAAMAPAVRFVETDHASVGVNPNEVPLEVSLTDARFGVGDSHVSVQETIRRLVAKPSHSP